MKKKSQKLHHCVNSLKQLIDLIEKLEINLKKKESNTRYMVELKILVLWECVKKQANRSKCEQIVKLYQEVHIGHK